jgi:hypothetical protein
MDALPTTAPASGRLARLAVRARRTAAVDLAGAPSPPATVDLAGAPVQSAAIDLAGAPPQPAATPVAARAMPSAVACAVAALERRGHVVRVTDRTAPGELSPGSARIAQLVLQDVVSALSRGATGALNVTVRLRTDRGELVVSVQTLRPVGRPGTGLPGERDEQTLRRRIEAAGGRATIRATHDGNWLASARLPL